MVSNVGIKASQTIVLKATEFVLSSVVALCEKSVGPTVSRDEIWEEIRDQSEVSDWGIKKFTQTLHNLKRSGLVTFNDKNSSVAYTNKAKLTMIDHFAKQRIGEDCYRFVSFDIPEVLRKRRDAFRRAIKRMGFIQIQKSLWVINKDVSDLVELAAYEYNIEKYVVYLVSARTDIDGIIKKKLIRKSNN
jgi:hypothetical protein